MYLLERVVKKLFYENRAIVSNHNGKKEKKTEKCEMNRLSSEHFLHHFRHHELPMFAKNIRV